MSIILAGHFQLQDEINQARAALLDAGFPDELISRFYVNEPGRHDLTPIGGDRMTSAGAKESPGGMLAGEATGAAVGAAVGAATTPVTGPLGVVVGGLVGAHVGSLYSFHKLKERGEAEQGAAPMGEASNVDEPRHAGMLVAVAVAGPHEEDKAVDVLRRLGARHIERAEGHIEHGDWTDFDPLQPAHLIH